MKALYLFSQINCCEATICAKLLSQQFEQLKLIYSFINFKIVNSKQSSRRQ